MRLSWACVLALCAACGSFEDEDIVVDLRILAMTASVPDQVVDVDLANPPDDPAELLAQLVPSEMCAYVADPVFERRLRWSLTLCVLNFDERCGGEPTLLLRSGIIDDPDHSIPAPRMCATIEPDGNLVGIVRAALLGDSLSGLGGVYYGVSFVVGGEDADRSLDLFAGKSVTVAPRIPAARRANINPSVDHFEAAIDGGEPVPLTMGRCVDLQAMGAARLEVSPRTRVRITPVEPPDAREPYVVPTLDGSTRMFTESLTYQWMASAGGFSSGSTGGPRDLATGNPAPLFTDWRAPDSKDLAGTTDVALWIVQRDERLGARYYEACIRVVVP